MRTSSSRSMILHGLSLAVEGIVRRAGELLLRLSARPSPGADLPRTAEEDGRGGADATEAEHYIHRPT